MRYLPTGMLILLSSLAPGALTPLQADTIAAGTYHTCALNSADHAKCWGRNHFGELGDGSNEDRHTPVFVEELNGVVAAVTAGNFHTCALSIGGRVKCWGFNIDGALGDGTRTQRSIPVFVEKAFGGKLGGISAIAGGGWFTCAATSSGGAWCWVDGNEGQIGDGNFFDQLNPSRVGSSLGTVIAIAAGDHDACTVSFGGRTECWGDNRSGQLGDGTTEDRGTPRLVKGLKEATAIAAGNYHTCALTSAGGVKCWGLNFDG